MTLNYSFRLVPIDFSYTTSYVNSNFCSNAHRLAAILKAYVTDDRQMDETL